MVRVEVPQVTGGKGAGMTVSRMALMLVASVAAGTLLFGAVAIGTQDRTPAGSATLVEPPPEPAWVGANGTVDPSKMPACVRVVGSDGLPVSKGDGEPVCVSRTELMQPPTGLPPKTPAAVNASRFVLEGERRIVELPASSPANVRH